MDGDVWIGAFFGGCVALAPYGIGVEGVGGRVCECVFPYVEFEFFGEREEAGLRLGVYEGGGCG